MQIYGHRKIDQFSFKKKRRKKIFKKWGKCAALDERGRLEKQGRGKQRHFSVREREAYAYFILVKWSYTKMSLSKVENKKNIFKTK